MSVTAPAPALVEVPVGLVDVSPDQYRTVFDPDRLAGLAASIAAVGLTLPVRVRPVGAARFVLVDGERRLRAVRDVLGWSTILAVVDGTERSPGELAVATWSANQSEHPSPMDDARGLAAICEATGSDVSAVAKLVGRPARWIRDRVCLLGLVDDVAHWVTTGDMGVGRAVLIAGLDANRQRLALAAHERGVNTETFRRLAGRLADEQAADTMFDASSFLQLEEIVVSVEAEVAELEEILTADVPVGVSEIADRLQVARTTVQKWQHRRLLPDPDFRVSGSPGWWWANIARWATVTGRA